MKKVKKVRNYNVGYKKYSQEFAKLRKESNVKQGMRKFTKKQYNQMRAEGETNKTILESQMFLNKKQQQEAWKHYLEIRQTIKPGSKKAYNNSYWGYNEEEEEGLGYHTKFEGLMRDKDAFHFLITDAMSHRKETDMTREDVLAQYGY